MGPASYIRSVADGNVVMRLLAVYLTSRGEIIYDL